MFPALAKPAHLRLVETHASRSGVVMLRCRRDNRAPVSFRPAPFLGASGLHKALDFVKALPHSRVV